MFFLVVFDGPTVLVDDANEPQPPGGVGIVPNKVSVE